MFVARRPNPRVIFCTVAIVLISIYGAVTLDVLSLYPQTTHSFQPPILVRDGLHPIAALTAQAERKWKDLLERQSVTLEQAVKQYRIRYDRDPPKGFDDWFRWAQDHGIKLIDEFDTISRDLAPFWGLSGAEIDRRRQSLLDLSQSDRLMWMTIRDGKVGDMPGRASTDKWPGNKNYHKIFDLIAHLLPDLDMVFNLYDLPLVYVSWEERERLTDAGKRGHYASNDDEIETPEDILQYSAFGYHALRSACPPGSPARMTEMDAVGEEYYRDIGASDMSWKLPPKQGSFVHDMARQMSVCYHPNLGNIHGNFIQPTIVLPLKRNRLYPVFSWTRYAESSDIAIPTTYRFDHSQHTDSDWKEMIPRVAWRGGLTGADTRDDTDTLSSQRYRLWTLVSEKFRRVPVLTKDVRDDNFHMASISSKVANLLWLDVGPSNSTHKQGIGHSRIAQSLVDIFDFLPYMHVGVRNQHKILLDVDGWGWSARYRELLKATGAVLKSTVFHEIISDWLIPWYHYIPLSYNYDEIYSIVGYYLGNENSSALPPHDTELRQIALNGQQWVQEHGMWEHHAAYMYRLSLEWARLSSDDRDALTYR